MEEEKKTFAIWVKKHKMELIIAGIGVSAIIAMALGAKNNETLEEMWVSHKKLVEKEPKGIPSVVVPQVPEAMHISDIVAISTPHTEQIPHREHIRNLPEGWKASAEKIATAAEHGYNLKPWQTWVEAYTTGRTAA